MVLSKHSINNGRIAADITNASIRLAVMAVRKHRLYKSVSTTCDDKIKYIYILIPACLYSNTKVGENQIAVFNGVPMKCALNGTVWIVRNLTDAEMQQYIASQVGRIMALEKSIIVSILEQW